MSQYQPTAPTQPARTARLKTLAARPVLIALMAAGMIAGSTGLAVAATTSPAHPAVTAGLGVGPTCPPALINKRCAGV
jgi:anti-sigma factor RsiW